MIITYFHVNRFYSSGWLTSIPFLVVWLFLGHNFAGGGWSGGITPSRFTQPWPKPFGRHCISALINNNNIYDYHCVTLVYHWIEYLVFLTMPSPWLLCFNKIYKTLMMKAGVRLECIWPTHLCYMYWQLHTQ